MNASVFTFSNQHAIKAALKALHFLLFILPKKSRNSICITGTKNTSKSQGYFRSCCTICSALQEDKATNTSYAEGS